MIFLKIYLILIVHWERLNGIILYGIVGGKDEHEIDIIQISMLSYACKEDIGKCLI